jgi:peroxiredoxin
MKSPRWFGVALLLIPVSFPHQARSEAPDPKPLPIGAAAPDFKLPGVDGKDYTLKSFEKSPYLLVVFTCNHCPTAQAYEQRIIQLHADYKDRGVALVAISPNDPKAVRLDELGYTDLSDSFEEMKIRAKDRKYAFPYLYDGATQQTSLAYGVVATPQLFLFDRDRKLRYMGRIDNSDVKTVTSHDARNAIDALLAGRQPSVQTTRVFGCSTKWADKRAEAEKYIARWNAEAVTLNELDEATLKKLVKNDTKKLLVVNLWASWCAPCLAELPDFVTMNRMYRKRDFQLVSISMDEVDKKDTALKALKELHVAATNYIMALPDRDRFGDLLDKSWTGAMPYTLIIAPGGKVLYRKGGAIDPLEVKRKIADTLGRTY